MAERDELLRPGDAADALRQAGARRERAIELLERALDDLPDEPADDASRDDLVAAAGYFGFDEAMCASFTDAELADVVRTWRTGRIETMARRLA
jgi:hypothetical protein